MDGVVVLRVAVTPEDLCLYYFSLFLLLLLLLHVLLLLLLQQMMIHHHVGVKQRLQVVS